MYLIDIQRWFGNVSAREVRRVRGREDSCLRWAGRAAGDAPGYTEKYYLLIPDYKQAPEYIAN